MGEQDHQADPHKAQKAARWTRLGARRKGQTDECMTDRRHPLILIFSTAKCDSLCAAVPRVLSVRGDIVGSLTASFEPHMIPVAQSGVRLRECKAAA
ncbi:MAG: hypothetical protein AMXMBFR20_16270 [Planctomycetia bacterium]